MARGLAFRGTPRRGCPVDSRDSPLFGGQRTSYSVGLLIRNMSASFLARHKPDRVGVVQAMLGPDASHPAATPASVLVVVFVCRQRDQVSGGPDAIVPLT